MSNNINDIYFYGGGVGIDLSKLHEMKSKQPPKTQYKMKTSLDQFIELLVKFSGDKPVMIENIDAP